MAKQKCRICGDPKPLTEKYYHTAKTNTTGFNRTCRVCINIIQRNYRRRIRAKEREAKSEASTYWGACLKDQAKRSAVTNYSIFKEVGKAAHRRVNKKTK